MSAKITFNGVEVTVTTAELGEAMRQLGLMPAMTQRQVPEPSLVTEARVAAPFQLMQADVSAHLRDQKELPLAHRRAQAIGSARPGDEKAYAIKLMKVVQSSGSSGALSRAVMMELGTSSPKGLGSVTVMINKALSEAGFSPGDVYTKARGPFGRVWVAGPRIKEATDALDPPL